MARRGAGSAHSLAQPQNKFIRTPASRNHVNPAMDFTQTPPGMLALDNMLYFAKHHQDAYIRPCGHVGDQLLDNRYMQNCVPVNVDGLYPIQVGKKNKSLKLIVLENSSREDKHECPFGRSSIELTKMLCEILKVGELPSDEEKS
ncbi:engulfment and cell motility protein 1 isoform 2 [Cricetulus griseus]|nr:engulfment and cell motility protein 1 isoform 2 [Cricetulus griseus]